MGQNKIKTTGFRFEDKNILDKLSIIAKRNKRTRNKEVEYALEKYVKTYEAEHGEIVIDTDTVSHN